MNLYEIDHTIQTIIDNDYTVDEETGEVNADIAEQLEQLAIDRDTKIENIALYIKNLKNLIDDIKVEEKALSDRRKARENKVIYLSFLLTESLTRANTSKFETAKCMLSFRKSEQVVIPDIDKLSKDYIKTEIKETPDKTAIKKAIKSGEVVEGATLEVKQNLQIK